MAKRNNRNNNGAARRAENFLENGVCVFMENKDIFALHFENEFGEIALQRQPQGNEKTFAIGFSEDSFDEREEDYPEEIANKRRVSIWRKRKNR